MSSCVGRNCGFLKSVAKSSKSQRRKLINGASADNIKAVAEIALNTLRGNVHLTPAQKTKLKRYKLKLRHLANKRLSAKHKKKLLVQNGGVLPLLVAPILSLIGGLAGKAIGRAVGL